MTTSPSSAFVTALRQELVAHAEATPARDRRRRTVAIAGTAILFLGGGAAAVAGLQAAGDRADLPLAAPYIVSGVGSATVPLPPAPDGALYALVELTCFDSVRCFMPGGGVEWDPTADVQPMTTGNPIPLTAAFDPHNVQRLDPIDPEVGVAVDVDDGSHWRLYAVYAERIDPTIATSEDGTTMGMRGLDIPTMVPVTMTDGQIGWVNFDQLTTGATVTLTSTGVVQAPLTAYGPDGVTVIGEADVSLALTSS